MDFKLSEKMYNALKWFTMVLLPAVATLYIMLADTWQLPNAPEVSATITALVVFLGIFLEINSAQFKLRLAKVKAMDTLTRIKLKLVISNQTYDVIKWVTTILLPAVVVLYVTLADVWQLPYPTEVAATMTAVIIFLGALLQISSLEYKTSMYVLSNVGQVIRQEMAVSSGPLSMRPETYDKVRFFAQVFLPAISTFYVAMAEIWGLPLSVEISTTIMAIVLFVNALLQVSTSKHNVAVAKLIK